MNVENTKLEEGAAKINPRKSKFGQIMFGDLAPGLQDADLLAAAAMFVEFRGSLNLSGCSKITVPFTTRQRGVAAVRRYLLESYPGTLEFEQAAEQLKQLRSQQRRK